MCPYLPFFFFFFFLAAVEEEKKSAVICIARSNLASLNNAPPRFPWRCLKSLGGYLQPLLPRMRRVAKY